MSKKFKSNIKDYGFTADEIAYQFTDGVFVSEKADAVDRMLEKLAAKKYSAVTKGK